jgi:glycosyltransferase involved in cell wall biosynthesis
VKDIRPYLAHADVAVAPLRIARGIQNKVLEAMAMGKPVVATWQATRALAVTSGMELWIETDPRRFAAAVAEAISGPKGSIIAHNGRAYVERNHDWAKILPEFDHYLDPIARDRRRLSGSPCDSARTAVTIGEDVLPAKLAVGTSWI